jgi:hypothetical protein
MARLQPVSHSHFKAKLGMEKRTLITYVFFFQEKVTYVVFGMGRRGF